MNRLSVSGNRPDVHAIEGGMPPPSPMLEAYHGTYQSLSPMPLALRLDDESELDSLPPLSVFTSRNSGRGHQRRESKGHSTGEKKRAVIYDGEEDAKAIAKALNHHSIDALTICDILPRLSHDQILDVRKEYKKQVKVSLLESRTTQTSHGCVLNDLQPMSSQKLLIRIIGARQGRQSFETHQDEDHRKLRQSSLCDCTRKMGE